MSAPAVADPVSRVCPACARRTNGQISGDCPICAGAGVLVLGRAALLRYPAEVVARAVEYAIELQAEADLAAKPVDLGRARARLTAMVVRLTRAGLLAPPAPPPRRSNSPHVTLSASAMHKSARVLSSSAAGLPYEEGTGTLLSAPPIRYETSTIVVDGTLPGFSAAGFLAALCQVSDPIDVLAPRGPDRASLNRAGEVLGRAAAT